MADGAQGDATAGGTVRWLAYVVMLVDELLLVDDL
jgi:hypothetical protein